ncbi:hypothetical protein Ancab_025607, partial [Ancistrocladus abbreviatus]
MKSSIASLSLLVIVVVLLADCFTSFKSDAQLIPENEVQTLKTITSKLNITNWHVSQTSCTDGSFNRPFSISSVVSNVTCNCSFSSRTVCHVTNIQLKGLNLSGALPAEFVNLSYLQEIDLSRNFINGSIPTSFAKLPLLILALLGNRITGSIPEEIGHISTLQELVLEDNLLGGPLPDSLGNLTSLKRLLLSANNFTGTIPETILQSEEPYRFDRWTSFYGKIPDFIGNWTKLNRLDMQGTSMEGPIPSSISMFKNLTELAISDLNGSSTVFPDLQNLTSLQYLILRNCLITGTIPTYIGQMTNLKTLDLSFNRLNGEIPSSLGNLDKLVYLFLTNNSLTGAVPGWVMQKQENFDLSYNNFTGSSQISCQQQSSVNLASSFSSTTSSLWCLGEHLPCPGKAEYYSLFINCGGSKMSYGGNDYEDDSNTLGPSTFASYSSTRWAYSSTGTFLGNDKANFLASNTFNLNMTGPAYYQTARLSPASLKYYALCLRSGSYRVRLHFAEIMYSADQTFASLGRRIFDVAIQGNRVLKDFNIVEEAGGVGKGIFREFNVPVDGGTLEISLYWAGKGTNAIPYRGVYGPLISAIEVTPNFKIGTGLSAGAIVGIVIASCAVVASVLVFLRMKGCLGGKDDKGE